MQNLVSLIESSEVEFLKHLIDPDHSSALLMIALSSFEKNKSMNYDIKTNIIFNLGKARIL